MKKRKIQLTSPLLCDLLHALAVEYNMPADSLADLAVKRLLDDVELLRNLRAGKVK